MRQNIRECPVLEKEFRGDEGKIDETSQPMKRNDARQTTTHEGEAEPRNAVFFDFSEG